MIESSKIRQAIEVIKIEQRYDRGDCLCPRCGLELRSPLTRNYFSAVEPDLRICGICSSEETSGRPTGIAQWFFVGKIREVPRNDLPGFTCNNGGCNA